MVFLDQSRVFGSQRILVTGASGFVGSRLVASSNAKANSIQFLAVTRHSNDPLLAIDIKSDTNWSDLLSGVDVVIHLAARVHVMHDQSSNPLQAYREANVDATLNLAKQAADAGVKRFIFLSSIKVNGEKTNSNKPFSELDMPSPQDPYAVSKLEAELGIREICEKSKMEFVLIRPPLIYGPGVKANFLKLMQLMQKRLPLPLGLINNKRSMLALDNLIDFILLSTSHPSAANQLFLLSDRENLSLRSLINHIAKSFGFGSARLISIPVGVLRFFGKCLGRSAAIDRLTDSLEINSQKARELLNWNPPLDTHQAITITVQDYLNHSKENIE